MVSRPNPNGSFENNTFSSSSANKGRISIKSAARLSLTSAYWQEVSADRQCCTQARNAMMANAAATVLINSNKSLLFDELQAVEDEDDDILMA